MSLTRAIAASQGTEVDETGYKGLVDNQGYFILNKILSVLRLKPALRCA
ncbi:hypothetical protein QUB30_28250 [Microcoleus sp. BROC3]